MTKTTTIHLTKKKTGRRSPLHTWHNGGNIEILQYARSLQNAAKTLVGKLERNQSGRTDLDVCPVVLLYRQALEINLKMLVGEGSNFLPSPTDPISLSTTHSVRWLAQIVSQIVKAVGWQNEFRCEGVSSLAEFSALVNEVEILDPVTKAIRSSRDRGSVPEFYRNFDIVKFAAKLDALLTLLNVTTDALAAMWDVKQGATAGPKFGDGEDFGPTIQ